MTVSGIGDISHTSNYVDGRCSLGPTDVSDTNGDVFHHAVATAISARASGTPGLPVSQTGRATDPITVTLDNIHYPAGSPGTASATYNLIMGNLGFDNGRASSETSTVSLNGLITGVKYEVEFLGPAKARRKTATSPTSPAARCSTSRTGTGHFAIGTFVADSATQQFTFSIRRKSYCDGDRTVPRCPSPRRSFAPAARPLWGSRCRRLAASCNNSTLAVRSWRSIWRWVDRGH